VDRLGLGRVGRRRTGGIRKTLLAERKKTTGGTGCEGTPPGKANLIKTPRMKTNTIDQ